MRNGVGGRLLGMTEMFAAGIQMGESPRWHDGRFWMCDWLAGEVLVFDADANREVVARVDGMPFSSMSLVGRGWTCRARCHGRSRSLGS